MLNKMMTMMMKLTTLWEIESNDDDDGTDDEEWGNILGTTAKIMGR